MAPQEHPTVLVVEDEPAQREVLGYNLEAEGFRVTSAGNGEEALMLVDEMRPDIIVLDWMMPNVSGIEVCRPEAEVIDRVSLAWGNPAAFQHKQPDPAVLHSVDPTLHLAALPTERVDDTLPD